MGKNDFTRNDCIRALNGLGFILCSQRGGRHDKYIYPPKNKFIMVPRHNDLHSQSAILKELKNIDGNLHKKFLELI